MREKVDDELNGRLKESEKSEMKHIKTPNGGREAPKEDAIIKTHKKGK
jgi:hypothetical protein